MLFYSILTVALLSSPHTEQTTPEMRPPSDLELALDPEVYVGKRMAVAASLSEPERAVLRLKLMMQLPGANDKRTLDVIQVLGEVGDKSSIEVLEDIIAQPTELSSNIRNAARGAIAKIRKRIDSER